MFLLFFAALVALHAPLLRLPFIWDEAGYYIPAARDLFLTGSLIPHSTVSNAHPPLVLAWLALGWKLFGYSILVARTSMLAVAAFALMGLYRLAERANNRSVAIGTTLVTALYPVFFVQSSLAHVDLAAAGLTFWALRAHLDDRRVATFFWFSLASLAKETAILAPLALAAWESAGFVFHVDNMRELRHFPQRSLARIAGLAATGIPLALWFAYHYSKTGFVFGNPEFFRYNVQATTHPVRIVLALFARLWQTFGYMGLWFVTVITLFAMTRPALSSATDNALETRTRIAIPIQLIFAVVILAYVCTLSVIGGAVLSRYMLPVVPLVIMVGVSTFWRRLAYWKLIVAALAAFFILGCFWNPPYSFPFEDNLGYRDYVQLHQAGARYVETHFRDARVLTAWPASDELNREWLGYVHQPMHVVRIENFSLEPVQAATASATPYDVALVFSTKYEPAFNVGGWPPWVRLRTQFFDYHRDLPPDVIAQMLGARVVMQEHRGAQWIAVLVIERPVDAELHAIQPSGALGVHDLPTNQDASKWQEWVFTTSHTPRPSMRRKASRAASVSCTSTSILESNPPHLTRATIIMSRRSAEITVPGITLRALIS